MSEETPMYPEAEAKRPGLFRRLWRFIKITFVVLVIIIALSYLPGSWLGEEGSRLRQAHDITLDIRDLTYGLAFDTASALYAGTRGLYQEYDDQLPEAVTDWLDPWLAEEPAEPMPASTPTAAPTSSQEAMPAEPESPAATPEQEADPNQ